MQMLSKYLLLVSCLACLACKQESGVVAQNPVNNTPLTKEYIKDVAGFPFGSSLDATLLKTDRNYQSVVEAEMTSISVENAQKWSTVHPSQNSFNFGDADGIVDWAVARKIRVHGHTLLWHSFNPTWLNNFQGDSAAWENLMKSHIQTVMKHYKGKVSSWDVVNEAFNDDGSLRHSQGKEEDQSIWAKKLGKDYIARAFVYAHEADPNALLFYNEYGQESKPAKIEATLAMVADFKKRGIPIHGLGIQMHIGVSQGDAGIENAIRKFAETGLKVHISELDILVSDWQKNDKLVYTDALKQKHSDKYKFVAKTYKSVVPKTQQWGITNWNVTDADSWITKWLKYTDWPLLFDSNYERKGTYYGFLNGLK